MNLNAFVAQKKRAIFDDLFAGQPPQEGEFSEERWKEGKAKSQPQMGSTQFTPDKIVLEFIYNDPLGAAVVLPVTLDAPERIVFMPVPEWVVDSIWQGEISGTFRFESEAKKLLEEFSLKLNPENNPEFFGPQRATRRE